MENFLIVVLSVIAGSVFSIGLNTWEINSKITKALDKLIEKLDEKTDEIAGNQIDIENEIQELKRTIKCD